MDKVSDYFNFKNILKTQGLYLRHPVFHSTSIENAEKILREGFKARAGGPGNDAYHDNSICFTRNLCFSEEDRFGSGEVIFVLDLAELKNRYKSYSYDWNSVANKPSTINKYVKNPSRFEYEERISRSPKSVKDLAEPETVIPPNYIKVIILKKSASIHIKSELYEKYGQSKIFVVRDGSNYTLVEALSGLYDFKQAIKSGHTYLVSEFLAQAYSNEDLKSYFLEAVRANNIDVVRLFIDYGLRVTDPLMLEIAAKNRNLALVKLLLKHGKNLDGTYAIDYAISYGKNDIAKLLLEKSLYTKTKMPLIIATSHSDAKIVQLLLHFGYNADNPDALEQSIFKGDVAIAALLLEHGASPSNKKLLEDASRSGYENIVELLLKHGADINNSRSLKYAVSYGNNEVVRLLLEHGAKADNPEDLWEAALAGNISGFDMLVSYGADVTKTLAYAINDDDATQLVGKNGLMGLFLKNGVDVNNQQVLKSAYNSAAKSIINLLKKHGADI